MSHERIQHDRHRLETLTAIFAKSSKMVFPLALPIPFAWQPGSRCSDDRHSKFMAVKSYKKNLSARCRESKWLIGSDF